MSDPNNPHSDTDGIIDGFDRDPDFNSNLCSGAVDTLENLVVDGTMTCGTTESITVYPTVTLDAPDVLELLSPRVTFQDEFRRGRRRRPDR